MVVHDDVHGGKETCVWQEVHAKKQTLHRVHVERKVGQSASDGFLLVQRSNFHNPNLRVECAPSVLKSEGNRA